MSGDVIAKPELTREQIERGCRIEDGRVVCPDLGVDTSVEDGTTSIQLGKQKIRAMSCRSNKKTGELDCTVQSSAKP